MKRLIMVSAIAALSGAWIAWRPQAGPSAAEQARWAQEAAAVTIVRDDWGIAHVHGKTDADAVFGMEYAQAEDDFSRVENNYITQLGRSAEAEGESALWRDLRYKIYYDPATLQKDYAASPAWLRQLMVAFADGLNFYLYRHPEVHPRVITHFEPWMALSFSEGSIGGDIEKINIQGLENFYGQPIVPTPPATPGGAQLVRDEFTPPPQFDDLSAPDPGGSNGIAISPNNTVAHHALLLINPHTSFYFRSELQMSSDSGLDAYGAATWGQFFIYQGFNPKIGWMHTSSGAMATSEFLETVSVAGDHFVYKHGSAELPVTTSTVSVAYKTPQGLQQRTFTIYHTQHGPVIARAADGRWETFAMMNDPVHALIQSYNRTKTSDVKSFAALFDLHTNSSNNTLLADSSGNIAYYHGNYIPKRDPKLDWSRPVDGSDPDTDFHGLLSVAETPHVVNPASGWVYNSNNWPWSAAGPDSPKREDFPPYVDSGRYESPRGRHAIRLLTGKKDFTLDSLQAAAFDSYQPWFEKPIPALVKAWDETPASDPLKAETAAPIALLRAWDLRWSADSVPTTVAIYWAQAVQRAARGGRGAARGTAPPSAAGASVGARQAAAAVPPEDALAERTSPQVMLAALVTAMNTLTTDFGTWKTPWGDVNRFQRLDDSIVGHYDDNQPSIPVEFTSATWGSLASFAAGRGGANKKLYGASGNSFVAVVEFGPTVRARAVTAGGESGDPHSRHFTDEAGRYATGNLRDVYFYPAQLQGHTERTYHPGE